MSNNKYIEDSFREKFDPDNIGNQGWNDPSDSVWDKIEANIKEKKHSRFGYPFFMLLSGFLISLISLGYLLNKNNQLSSQISEIKVQLQECGTQNQENIETPQAIIQDAKANSISNPATPINYVPAPTQNDRLVQKDMVASNIKNDVNQSYEPQPTKNTVSLTNNVSNESKLNMLDALSLFSKPEKNITEASSSPIEDRTINLAKAPNRSASIITYNRHNIIIQNPEIVLPATEHIPRSFVTISSGLINNSLITSGNQSTALTELIDKEYANLGYEIGIKYTAGITKNISISAGLGATYQEFVTEYNLELPYEVGQEIIENGVGYIDFEHSLPTSFGNTDTQLRLRRSNADQPLDESEVNIDFDTEHTLISAIAPITVDYHFNDITSGLYAGFDFVPSYIISARSGISSVVSQHSEIQSTNNESTSEYKTLQKVNLGLGAHIGYRYAFSEKSGLEIGAKYLRKVGSYFSTDSFSSRSQGIHANAGYYFRF